MNSIGVPFAAFIISFRRSGDLRSMTVVAPSASSWEALYKEAVVMIGEKPESLASWIAEKKGHCVRHTLQETA